MAGFVGRLGNLTRPALMAGLASTLRPGIVQVASAAVRTMERTRRFVELVQAAMRQTGRVQVELNPCDVWTAAELITAARMARQPLSLQLGGRDFRVTLRDIRVRCPSQVVEWDYEMSWGPFRDGQVYTGTVTILGQQVLVGSLDQSQRPIAATICYRNFEILRIDVPAGVSGRFGPDYARRVPQRLLAEASALPLCLNTVGVPGIGIG